MASTGQLGANQHWVFNEQERAVLDQFKTQYMDTPSPEARKDLTKEEIFPGIFNYWKGLGLIFTTTQEDKKKVVCWKFNSEQNLIHTVGNNLLDP